MTRGVTPKLLTLATLAALCLISAAVLARLEAAVIAAPLLTALAYGASAARAPAIRVSVWAEPDRCLEDEVVELAIEIAAGEHVPEAEIALGPMQGLEVEGPSRWSVKLDPEEPTLLQVGVRATRWGVHRVALIGVRAHTRGNLITFEHIVDPHLGIKVYPKFERIQKGIAPADTQVFAGNYVSKVAGDGIEFANVRDFAQGDSVRRINWRVTARRSGLQVNEFHPERNSDLVLFLDSFSDVGPPGFSSLDLSVRGAAALARHHLKHNDRVGLISFGGVLSWLTATSGTVQLYRIVDYLLNVHATVSYAWKDIDYLPSRTLPPLASIIAFSPLIEPRSITALTDLAARGFPLMVIETFSEKDVEPHPSAEGRLAYRVWKLQRAALRYDLETRGVPVIHWDGHFGLESLLAGLPRRRMRVRVTT
ncbi:MAG: hypothetical protein QOG21_2180 [Actinomycetota bacterium]|jgi:uncharacterized protein (DUF58 family)|nr:hypothetical protein [Actinomycetota bacterium]